MFEQCLYFNTAALSRLLDREWSKAFKPFGLSTPQAFMLRAVLARPGMLQRELADLLTIARPTATRLLDGLQARDLIERRAGANDGREWEIHPTTDARVMAAGLEQASGTVTRRLKRVLGERRFADVVAQLHEARDTIA